MNLLPAVARAAALVLLVLGSVAVPAHAAEPPRGADGLLAVPPLARVTDFSGVLSAEQRQQLVAKLEAFETAHGAQIAILVVPSTQPEPIEDFAHRVGDRWKIGRAGIGDGVLIVVATQDRRARIDVARSLEGAIPDATARRIIREAMAPRFRDNDFAGGISNALDLAFKQIEGEGLPTPAGVSPRTVDAGEATISLLIPFVVVGIVIGVILRRIFGVPGALMAGGGAGALAGTMLSSAMLGGLAGIAVFFLTLGAGSRRSRVLGRHGPVILPGGFGGGWSGGGSSGGGWNSGGGGDFSGGGASGDW